MKIKFYGTRGSIPVCDAGFQKYGGNTTCVCVSDLPSGNIVIFDAGTGIRKLGKEITNGVLPVKGKIYLAFSHFHWDHVQGFPFFAPAYNPEQEIILTFGPETPLKELKNIFADLMQNQYFPVQFEDMGGHCAIRPMAHHHVDIEGGEVMASTHTHPGGAMGYRIETNGKTLVYCTDVEHPNGIDENVVALAKNADMLIHDAQYTPEELKTHKGWGHSSWEQAIAVATQANVQKLVLTHHDPDHDDTFLDKIEEDCQEMFANCILARDNMELKI